LNLNPTKNIKTNVISVISVPFSSIADRQSRLTQVIIVVDHQPGPITTSMSLTEDEETAAALAPTPS
jgi:hypothetical protein